MLNFEITTGMINNVDKLTEKIMDIKRKFDSNPVDEQIVKKYKTLIVILSCLEDIDEECISNKSKELQELQEIQENFINEKNSMSDDKEIDTKSKQKNMLKENFEILIDDYYCNINNKNSLKQTFNLTKIVNHENIIFV